MGALRNGYGVLKTYSSVQSADARGRELYA